ncbi:MAG TPA: Uma2 family endonuclease [Thermoanaerobaculia bacterium]|nr:Uma2 family endonuclease [Thermoanaerobaculia bacterium]
MEHSVATTAAKLTYEDFVGFPNDGLRHEILDGEHYVSPSPNPRHQTVLLNLYRALDAFIHPRRLGRLFCVAIDVLLAEHDVVVPDLLFVRSERMGIFTAANCQGAPDLLVEVLSPSGRKRDEVIKRDRYEKTGVAEYWLVDPDAETVKVFRRDGERYGRPELLSLHQGDSLTTALLPDLVIPLAAVFEE